MDPISSVAEHIVKTRFEDLPKDVVEKVKLFILDSLGVALPGSGAPGVPQVSGLMAELGGKPEATVFVYGHKLTVMDAAMVNSMMVHAMDLDDLHEDSIVHPSCCQVPTAFAIAEQRSPMNGKDLITAIALGVDLSCRFALSVISGVGFIRSGICGIFGAVANAAKLRNCSKETIINAMGIALSHTAGNAQVLLDGALVKRMQPGFMARDGIFSVLLAERGMTGPANVLAGKYGFLELYKRGDIYPDRILKDLGTFFEVSNVSAKPFPGGRFIHGPAEIGIEISKKENLTADQIAELTIFMPQTAVTYCGSTYDPDRGNPQVMAQFCARYAAAAGIVRRDFFVAEFDEKVIRDPVIGNLARKAKIVVDETVKDPTATTPVSLEIKTKDGRVLSGKVQYLKGHPKNFLSKEEFLTKFRKCVDLSPVRISEENISKMVESIDRMENVTDVAEIPKLLTKKNT
jgi:2-methylcitrate dehydratase PrpD